MKKKFTILIAALALLTMGVLPGRAVGQAPVNTVLWGETWTGGTAGEKPSAYGFEGTTIYGDATITYAQSNQNSYLYNETLAGGTAPELLLSRSNNTWTISNIPSGQATGMSLTFLSNKTTFSVTSPTNGITITGNQKSWTITASNTVNNFDLVIKNTGSTNARIDNIALIVTTAGSGGGSTLEDNDLELGAESLALDLHNNPNTGTVSYTTSSDGAVTVTGGTGYVTTEVDETNKIITVTPVAVTTSAQTITVSQAADDTYAAGSQTFTVTVANSTPTVNVTYHANGGTGNDIVATPYQGSDYTVAANTFTRTGYAFTKWHTTDAGSGGTDYEPGDVILNIQNNIDLFAQWEESSQTTATLNIQSYAAANSWQNDTRYETAIVDDVTFTASSGTNTGKYYTSGHQWRYYQNENATITISVPDGYNLVSITPTYAIQNGGVLLNGSTQVASGSTVSVSGQSVTFSVGNSGSATNGQVRFTNIDVIYEPEGGTPAPSYTISNNDEIAYDATSGSFNFTVQNAVDGGVTTVAEEVEWISNAAVSENSITFTTTVNTTATSRSGVITLTYTYNTNETITKEVTVTQAGNPNVVDNISDITELNHNYHVKGQVVATNARGFVIGDGTGYVYTYMGNTSFSHGVGDKLSISGSTATYGQILQFNNTATIETVTETNYDGTPAVTVITEVPDYSEGYHLSTYLQFEGDLTKTGDYYYVAVGEGSICMSYPTTAQGTTLTNLLTKTVRVKGYFAGISGSTGFTVMIESVEEVLNPTISINPTTANPFTYVYGSGPSEAQEFTVTGTNLTSDDIDATITVGDSYFEVSDGGDYTNTVTIGNGDAILIRMKAGLNKGNNYQGTLTLSTDGATNVTVALSGTVTGQTYNIVLIQPTAGGTIASDLEVAEEGATVTLTATPAAAYNFGSWAVEDEDENPITVTDNQFEMPASDVLVTATFTLKDTYAITCAVTPEGAALMEADPASAYEGQTVTLSYVAETGYTLSSIVITKTEDGSATGITPAASGDDYTFTMPGYAVTATSTFISEMFNGDFMPFSGDLVEGDYLIVYDNGAMKNTISSKRFDYEDVTPSEGVISNPSNDIVWHIAPSETEGYWTIYNAKVGQYVGSAGANSDMSLESSATADKVLWSTSGSYEFRNKGNEGSSTRYLRRNGTYGFANYSTSTGGALTLYKHTVLTPHTITFNGNGGETAGSETTYTQIVYDGIETTLTANQFTKENAAFAGWALTAEGDVVYANEAAITVTEDLSLYAQWSTVYTATVDNAIVGGSVLANGMASIGVAAGTEITLTYSQNPGYAFNAWNVYKYGDPTTTITVDNNKFMMPEYDVIVSATFVEATTYSLVTDASQIVSGMHYIIASKTDGAAKAMAAQNDNNRGSVDVTVSNSMIQETEGVYEFVINGPFTFNDKDYCYTIYDKNALSTGFLYAASSGSNYLRTKAQLDANGKWAIEIDGSSHKATIKAQGTNTRNWMRNNGGLFSCYSSGQADIYLYVKDNDHNLEYYGSDITIDDDELVSNSVVVGNGSVVTFTGTNDNPDKLIIEDGGQLIHDSDNVAATIQRKVNGYDTSKDGDNSGYELIASPVTDALDVDTETNLTDDGEYDLYIFDQSKAQEEWRNYKKTPNPDFTSIENGKGYLYANSADVTISFSGTLKPSDENVEIVLDYEDGHPFTGWNLVGNPFACNAYAFDTIGKSLAFYKMNDAGDDFEAATGPIAPMEGIFVYASATGKTFEFTRTAPAPVEAGKGNLNLEVAQVVTNRDAHKATDNAIIRFDGGSTLEKFSFSENNAKLYFPQNGKDYAVVTAEAQGELPFYFKAAENGTYTISFSMDNVEFGYLHLIDNKTGNDVDLRQTPSYTFEASTIDYASRFRLVFRAIGNENDSENNDFGFFDANGNFLILGIEGTATLQVMDVMGRVISNETFSGDYSKAINASAGVYMLRLIQGSDVRTQKVVVK